MANDPSFLARRLWRVNQRLVLQNLLPHSKQSSLASADHSTVWSLAVRWPDCQSQNQTTSSVLLRVGQTPTSITQPNLLMPPAGAWNPPPCATLGTDGVSPGRHSSHSPPWTAAIADESPPTVVSLLFSRYIHSISNTGPFGEGLATALDEAMFCLEVAAQAPRLTQSRPAKVSCGNKVGIGADLD